MFPLALLFLTSFPSLFARRQQSTETLKYRDTSILGGPRTVFNKTEIGLEVKRSHPGHSAIDIHPAMKNRLAATLASVSIPTPRGQAVVGPDPGFSGFRGLTHVDQRFAGTGVYTNTQFSLEPPDEGLCVGNGFVVEAVNNALAVYGTSGTRLSGPTALNQFFRLAPEFVRPNGPFGAFLSDPKCYFDADTRRWFVTELEIDIDPVTGNLPTTPRSRSRSAKLQTQPVNTICFRLTRRMPATPAAPVLATSL